MRMLLSFSCLLIAGVSIPLISGQITPNPTYGFRTPLTLSNPDIWYQANAFSGWTLLIAELVTIVALWLIPNRVANRPWLIYVILLAVYLMPLIICLAISLLYLNRFA